MNKLRWGLVGAGDIAEKRVAPALQHATRSELVAVSRRRPDMAEKFARKFGASRWHSTWEDLVKDAEIDAVYVATPVDLHANITIAAAQAGKHVLCEKSMALNVADCDRMIRAAEINGVKLGVAYYRHLYPIIQRVKALLKDHTIGVPVIVQINAFERFNPAPDHQRAWLLNPLIAGGGPMFDFGCHRIEVLQNLLGKVTTVSKMLANVVYTREVEDTAAAIVRCETGPIAVLNVTHAAAEPQDTLRIFGSAGSIHIPKLNGSELHIVQGNNETVESHPAPENFHQPLIEQFIEAVLNDGQPVVDGQIGREVNRLLAMIYA